jgi:hypothetical protein
VHIPGNRLIVVFFLVAALLPVCTDALDSAVPVPPQDIVMENNTVNVGIHLINIYNFDYQTGQYTYDMYVFFFWTDPDISTIDWYLMNGYPTYPGAKLLVQQSKNSTIKSELYRVRASLATSLEPTNYPFDQVTLPVSIEVLTHNHTTTLVWMAPETGINTGFANVGWSRPVYQLNTSVSHYPRGLDSPRADMVIVMDRNLFGAFMKSILPPLVFCFVAGICFLIRMHDSSAFTLRIGISTSMPLAAILFSVAEQGSIPPVSELTLFHIFIVATICFIALGLVVTALCYEEWNRIGSHQHVDRLNRIGFLISALVPLALFGLMVRMR